MGTFGRRYILFASLLLSILPISTQIDRERVPNQVSWSNILLTLQEAQNTERISIEAKDYIIECLIERSHQVTSSSKATRFSNSDHSKLKRIIGNFINIIICATLFLSCGIVLYFTPLISIPIGAFLIFVALKINHVSNFWYPNRFWLMLIGAVSYNVGFIDVLLFRNNIALCIYLAGHLVLFCINDPYGLLYYFGIVGILLECFSAFKLKIYSYFISYSHALFSIILLCLARSRYIPGTLGGLPEYLGMFLLLFISDVAWIHCTTIKFSKFSPFQYLMHLSTKLGFLGLLYRDIHVSFNLYFFTLNLGEYILALSTLGLISNHTYGLWISMDSTWPRLGFQILFVLLIGCVSLNTDNKYLALASCASLAMYSWLALIYRQPDFRKELGLLFLHFFISLITFSLAIINSSAIAHWIALMVALFTSASIWKSWHSFIPLQCIGYLIFGLLLDNKTLLFIGILLLMGFHHKFLERIHKKYRTQLMVIHVLGLVFSFTFVGFFVYFYEMIFSIFQYLLFKLGIFQIQSFILSIVNNNSVIRIFLFFLWPLSVHKMYTTVNLYNIMFSFLCVTILGISNSWFQSENNKPNSNIDYFSPSLEDSDLMPRLIIQEMTVNFPQDTDGNGVVFSVRALKHPQFRIDRATLYVTGEEFWNSVFSIYDKPELIQSKFPLKLMPSILSKKLFNQIEDEVLLYFQFFTGFKGQKKVSQNTLRTILRKLVSYGDASIKIRVTYMSKNSAQKEGILFSLDMKPSKLLNSIRESLQLQPLFEYW